MTPLWNVLLPVLVGGAIGIVGSFVGPFFLQHLKDVADKKRKRAEKCEELIGAVVEHFHWMGKLRGFKAFGYGSGPSLSPITKIQAITGTYFPELQALVNQFEYVSNEYQIWMFEMGQKRVRNEPMADGSTKHNDVLSSYTEKQKAVLTELGNFAQREF